MITAIVNPNSAGGNTGQEWASIRSVLERELGALQVSMTETHLQAVELTRHALKAGAKTVIAVGGDGTTSEVVNGFFEYGQPINPSAALAVISRGTGKDFIRSLRFPRNLNDIARAIKFTIPKSCDVVKMRLQPTNGGPAERFFLNIADLGVGGMVADMVNTGTNPLGGKLGFLWAGIRSTLFHYKNTPMRIELDGNILSQDTPHYFVAVANGKFFGGGMHIAPDARLNDGAFDIVLVGNLTLPEKVRFAFKLYRGKAGELDKIHVFRGKRLTVSSPHNVLIEADGEYVGKTDAEFGIVPLAIQVIGI